MGKIKQHEVDAVSIYPHTAAGSDARLPSYHFTHACLRVALASVLRAPGQPTSADEKRKRDKYEVECRGRNYDFVPFAESTILGIWAIQLRIF